MMKTSNHYLFVVVITCPPLPVLTTPVQTGVDITYSSVIKYRCDTGRFANGHTQITIICQDSGQWNGTASECNGKGF